MAETTGALPDFDALWDYDHPDATEAAFQKLLPAAEASGDLDYVAQLRTQIARAQALQMKFDAATETLDRVASSLRPDMKVAHVRLLLERGRVLRSSKRVEESRPFFLEAWNAAREAKADAYAVDAAHMMGIVESGDASIDWNRKAIAAADSSTEPRARRWLGSLYNNLGWTYHGKGEYEAALDLFQKALAARREAGSPGDVRVARWCVARATRSLGRLEEALEAQRGLLAENEAEGSPDGYVYEEIAECLAGLQRDVEAAPYFATAYRLLSEDKWLQRDEPERLERLRRLGEAPADAPAPTR